MISTWFERYHGAVHDDKERAKRYSSAVSFSGTATIARTKNNLKRFEDGELEAWSKRAWDLFDEMYDDAYFGNITRPATGHAGCSP